MNNIDSRVHGHKRAKKVIASLLRRSQDRYYKKCVLGQTEGLQDTLKCLLIGQSGTGKTHLMKSFSDIYGFPLICIDATQLMPTGNKDGMNVGQLKALIDKTAQELTKTPKYHSPEGVINQMVIFVDEFDKLGTSFDSSGNWNKHVQANFLTMIDNKEEFAGISWVFAGAFTSLFEQKGVVKKSIGFFNENVEKTEEKEILDEDIIKSGIITELLGRISLIVQLDTFTENDFREVLHERLLPSYPQLSLEPDTLDKIVKKAMGSSQGIRSMTRQLEMLAIDAEEDEEEHIMASHYAL